MCGYHSKSRSPSYSPRRSPSPSQSSHKRRGDKNRSRRRRSRSDERGRRKASSRYDRGRESRARGYDNRNGQRNRSEEKNARVKRHNSRSRSRARRDRSPVRYRRDRSRSTDRGHDSIDRETYYLISHRDHIVRIAGKIAWSIRRRETLKPLMASGPPAVATALGILAKVRHFLAQDESPTEILFSPRFQAENNREKIIFYLRAEPGQRKEPESEESLTVSSRSKIAPIAGAIAGRARENGVGVLLEAIGDDAVQTCVSAMAMARGFLETDNITFSAVVSLEEISKKGKDGIRRDLINFRVKCYLDD